MNVVCHFFLRTRPAPRKLIITSKPNPLAKQFDSDDDDDLAIYKPGQEPEPRHNPYGPTKSASADASTSRNGNHRSTPSEDPFSNTRGVFDPSYGQSQNPASYGGGQAANRFGTAVDLSNQGIGRYDDLNDDDEYKPF